MNGRIYPFLFVILFSLLGCSSEEKPSKISLYYNLEDFTLSQIKQLDSLRPTIAKTVVSGDSRETRKLNEVSWEKELDLFVQADLNKPAFRNSYLVEEPTPHTVVYRAKDQEDVPVKLLKIELDARTGKPQRIEATMGSDNYLYHSHKKLLMTYGEAPNGLWSLRTYQIVGYQQLAFFSKKGYEVSGDLL